MVHSARILRGMKTAGVSDEELVQAAWPMAVGKVIAARTTRIRLEGTALTVHVEDEIWQRQLGTLRRQIIESLEKVMGAAVVSDIQFRVAPSRRLPQREESLPSGADEADGIVDPVLRRVYIASRKRASA